MAPLTDPDRLAAYKDALSNWRPHGYILFDLSETTNKWVKQELDNFTLKEIGLLMFEYAEAGGEIDEVRETRPEWSSEYEFHYDLRFMIQDKPVYIETRLKYHEPFQPDEPVILVVNIHAP